MLRPRHSVAWWWCALASGSIVAWGSGCEAPKQTAVMVEVDSDIQRTEMDRVRLRIDSVAGDQTRTTRLDTEYQLAERGAGGSGGSVEGSAEVRLPIRIAVFPRSAPDGVIHVVATGLAPAPGNATVSASAQLAFVPGRSLLLRLQLYRVCVELTCDEGTTCIQVGDDPVCVDEDIGKPECELRDLELERVDGCEDPCASAADCDDGTECTTDLCQNGSCSHEPGCGGATPLCCGAVCAACCADADCDDGLPCTADACDGGACQHTSICDCTVDDDCGGGLCCDGACLGCCDAGDCADGDGCTDDVCQAGGCANPDHVCADDGDPCTVELCQDGVCGADPLCDEGLICCEGACNTQCCSEADCPDPDPCATYPCEAGRCVKRYRPEGTPCGEGGICNGPPEECVQCLDDGDCGEKPCETATCVEQACVWTPLPDGTVCDGGLQCCSGVCGGCCDVADCQVPDNPCRTVDCIEGLCAESCLDNDTVCGAGLTCRDCTCR